MTVADEIAKLAQLRDRGALSDEEFEAQKRRLLNQGIAAVSPQPPGGQPIPPPAAPPPDPARAAKAKKLVIWSHCLGWPELAAPTPSRSARPAPPGPLGAGKTVAPPYRRS